MKNPFHRKVKAMPQKKERKTEKETISLPKVSDSTLLSAIDKARIEYNQALYNARKQAEYDNYQSQLVGKNMAAPGPGIGSNDYFRNIMKQMQQAQAQQLSQVQGSIYSFGGGTAKKPARSAMTMKPDPLIVADFGEEKKTKPQKKGVSFDSVILEDWKKQAIIETIEQSDNYDLIFEQWGFGEVMEKGKAISMLFWGPPGTGKTLMAQAIADKIGQDLLIIGSAEIESSEPGGAERAIKQFFQTKDKVLLFDECDSLVYERAAVGAILGAQVNALLTGLENYEGTVIFTTNRLGVLDEAFNRRLSLKLEFPMPDLVHRIDIWKRMFPKKAPLAKNINWERLAGIEVTGGYIKNAVLRAARMAASKKMKTITEKVIVEALRLEIESMIEFEEARKSVHHVPRQLGPGITKTSTMNKVKGA